MDDNELYHAGIKGMKWGVRRYQNKDGSLTPEGRKRYGYGQGARDAMNKVAGAAKSKFKSAVDQHKAKKAAEKAAEEEAKEKNRPVRSLSDAELRAKINRLTLERQALDLERQISNLDPKTVSEGKKFVGDIGSKVLTPAIMDAGKRVMTDFLTKKGMELMGLSDKDSMKELKKTVEGLNLQKQKRDLEKALRGDGDSDEEIARTAKRMANEETIARLKKQREDREKAERESEPREETVKDEGNSKSNNAKPKYDASSEPEIIIDNDTTMPAIRKTKEHERGKKFINEMFDY